MRILAIFFAATGVARAAYWMAEVAHQGISPYHPNPNYKVFRNVKDFGAVGDGVTDDTAAINEAISSGGRCGPGICKGQTTSPATVYFPPGTYLISNSIIDFFYTQIIGDPTDRPVIKASPSFPTNTTLGLLDGNQYGANGLAWGATNVFFRQVRNLIFDTTAIPADQNALGIHWPSSQATAITNCVFHLAKGPASQHVGIFIEEGSGGLMNDLEFHGGMYGANFGNQQYTARNLTFFNAQVAINQLWDWGWTYKSIHVESCGTGIQMQDNGTSSITLIDSFFKNVGTAVKTIRNPGISMPPSAGSLVMENVVFDNVGKVLVGPVGTILPGSEEEMVNKGFVMGHIYTPEGPTDYTGSIASYFRVPPALISGNKYYERSKPHYEDIPVTNFISARSFGAKGDGKTDDTLALNNLFKYVTSNPAAGLVAFVDAGTYIVTDTIFIPPHARIVGEALASIIMGTGPKFSDMANPHPVTKVGLPGQRGPIEWSDMIISTRGATAGAKLIEYNLDSLSETHAGGMWDVHVRVGGFAGTELTVAECPTAPNTTTINGNCIAAWVSVHFTKSSANVFMENCWIWIADHDLEDQDYTRVTVYAGRGLFIESAAGKIFISASGSEHHVLYQYQLYHTRDIYMGQIQSETPYYQPSPDATVPFPAVEAYHDPDFVTSCKNSSSVLPCAMAWGLRILSSHDVVIFGAGLYSFFNNYSTDCSQIGAGARCQARILELRDTKWCRAVNGTEVYNLNIVGTTSMITWNGEDVALYSDNIAGFTAGIAMYSPVG